MSKVLQALKEARVRGRMSKVLEALKEASISVACLLDDVVVDEDDDLNCELDLNILQKDIEHLQDQITIIKNNIEKYRFILEEEK
jgi:ACT domain-containing protein|tara:strand:+ start:332 stop:586 length:255 start_codon:yes stop_codon:yes gene_type:complete